MLEFFLVCIVLAILFLVLTYYTGKAYLSGYEAATSGFIIAVSRIVTPVVISMKDGVFYVYDLDDNFITQGDTIEKIQENLSANKTKAYTISKVLENNNESV